MRLRAIAAVVLAPLAVAACAAPPTVEPVAEREVATGAPGPARERIVAHGTGDVSLDPDYLPALRAKGYAYAWSGLDGLFAADYLTIVNAPAVVERGGRRIAVLGFGGVVPTAEWLATPRSPASRPATIPT